MQNRYAEEHNIHMDEKAEQNSYIARIICDDKVVFQMEKPFHNRFSLLEIHNQFLSVLEEYEKDGRLPAKASRLKKFHPDAAHNN